MYIIYFKEYNTKIYFKGTGREGDDWIYLAHYKDYCQALVFTVMNFQGF
jgi:hypothetical protein